MHISDSILEQISLPVGLFDVESLKLVYFNKVLSVWLPEAKKDCNLNDLLPQIQTEAKLKRALGKQRNFRVDAESSIGGKTKPVQYVFSVDEFEGQKVWLLSIQDASELAKNKSMLASYSQMVEASARSLEHKNRQMQLILDSVEQGLVTTDLDGTVRPEFSAAVTSWLGNPEENEKIWDWLARTDEGAADWMQLAWEMIADGYIPLEVALGQLPRRIKSQHRILSCHYRLLNIEEEPNAIFIVIDNITETLRQIAEDRLQKDFAESVERFTHDAETFFGIFL